VNFYWSSIAYIIVAAYFAITGFYGLITKKPLVLSARHSFWLLLLIFSPNIFFLLQYTFKYGFEIRDYVFWPIYLLLLSFLWYRNRGYVIYGIADNSFDTALQALSISGGYLRITRMRWMGTIELLPKQYRQRTLVKSTACDLREYFDTNQITSSPRAHLLSIAASIFIFLAAIWMYRLAVSV
jgi:hypothetical protein